MDKSLRTKQHKALQELLKTARLEASLTQEQLAKRLSKPQSFVAKYEGGERRIDVVEFLSICESLEKDPLKLLLTLIKK